VCVSNNLHHAFIFHHTAATSICSSPSVHGKS